MPHYQLGGVMNYSDYLAKVKRKMVNVDISNKCQVRCPLCERFIKDKALMTERIKQSQDISSEDFKKLVAYFPQLNLCGTISDPIYHKNFLELLDLMSPNGYYRVNTNGSGKDLDWYRVAFDKSKNNVEWAFSLDGLIDTSSIYRINQNTAQTWAAMLLGSQLGIKIIWKYVVFNFNEHQIDEAKLLSKKNNFILEIIKSTRWEGDVALSLRPSDKWVSANTDNDRVQFL